MLLPLQSNDVLAEAANVVKVLEGVGILFGIAQLWLGRSERREAERRSALLARKAANYQAWQVVNSAFGKGGSGGRIDALQDLVANDVSLAGVKLDGAWLEGVKLREATLRQASLRDTRLIGADLTEASLEGADLTAADLSGAAMHGVFLRAANLSGAMLGTADLSCADLRDVTGWREVASFSYTNIQDVRNAPPGFIEGALAKGAIQGDQPALEPSSQSYSQEFRSV